MGVYKSSWIIFTILINLSNHVLKADVSLLWVIYIYITFIYSESVIFVFICTINNHAIVIIPIYNGLF